MPSRSSSLSGALLALALLGGGAAAPRAAAQVPEWVPEEYRDFIYRSVDDRSVWERAMNALDVSVRDVGPSFALVAGISRYPNMSGRAADLGPARVDVEKMVAYLEREPESFNEIVVLLDEDVTAENLRYFLTQYFPRRLSATPRSRFLFAYSGHGMTAENGRGYLLTSEAISLTDRFNTIPMVSLRADFQEVIDSGFQVLALINACYGAGFFNMSLAFGEEDLPIPQREGAHAITAGGAGELTWHDASFGEGSIFFEAVLAGLDGRADKLPNDGIVSVGELETYLKGTIASFTDARQNPAGGDLIPQRSPGGFFFLDRHRQIENANAEPLEGEWWSGIAFGEDASDDRGQTNGTTTTLSAEYTAAIDAYIATITRVRELAGRWEGEAQEPDGTSFNVEIEITPECDIGGDCGEIAVSHVPCRGRISLTSESRAEEIEFYVDDFDASSNMSLCTEGAGEVFKLTEDGKLHYLATYSGATGILSRVE